MKKLFLLITMIMMLCSCSGAQSVIPVVQGACAKAVPVLQQIQGYILDGELVLNQVEAIEIIIPESFRSELVLAIDVARLALRAADATAQTLVDVCDSTDAGTLPDPGVIMADFIKAWDSIAAIVTKAQSGGGLKVAKPIQPPLALKLRH